MTADPGPTRPRSAVVGVDGSENSLAALDWTLRCWAPPASTVHVVYSGGHDEDRDELERRWVASRATSGVDLHLHLTVKDPAEALIEVADAEEAELIALGVHAGPPLVPRAVGSVTHKVLRLAARPVAVVRAGWTDTSDGPIVVGVGDGPATRSALDWSVSFASGRTQPLLLVRAVDIHPIFGLDDPVEVLASYLDPDQLVRWAQDELDRTARELSDGGARVTTRVTTGAAGRRLVDASGDALVLVIGKHFDGRLTGYLTGTCLHHALIHARCPVIVVPQ